jgi:hypothetical protein
MMVVHMLSPDERYDQIYVSNYTTLRVRDELARLGGVGDVIVFGARDYAMRIWLDPEKIAMRGLTASDVLAGLRRQNVQVAAGAVGQAPQQSSVPFEMTVEAPGRLVDPERFGEVVVATGAGGQLVRVRDIGRVELGAQDYVSDAYLFGKPAVAIGIFQRPGSNTLETAGQVEATMQRLSKDFPQGLEYRVVYKSHRVCRLLDRGGPEDAPRSGGSCCPGDLPFLAEHSGGHHPGSGDSCLHPGSLHGPPRHGRVDQHALALRTRAGDRDRGRRRHRRGRERRAEY